MSDKPKSAPVNEGGVIKNKDGVIVSDNPTAPDVRGSEIPAILRHSSEVSRQNRLKELARRNKDVAWLLAEVVKGSRPHAPHAPHETHSTHAAPGKTVLQQAAQKNPKK